VAVPTCIGLHARDLRPIVHQLIHKGANPRVLNVLLETPISLASHFGYEGLADYMRKARSKVEQHILAKALISSSLTEVKQRAREEGSVEVVLELEPRAWNVLRDVDLLKRLNDRYKDCK